MPDLRQWEGVRRDGTAIGGGAHYAQNVRYWLDGELQRRHGLTKFTAQGGIVLTHFRTALTGHWAVFRTSTGTIEAVAAS